MTDARFAEAVARIDDRADWDRGFITDPFAGDAAARRGLRRTRAVLDALGAPDRRLRLIHIAGSKGKGSTAVFTAAILEAAGIRAGRYTSPHLHDWRERFVIAGQPVSEAAFAGLVDRTLAAVVEVEAASPGLGRVTAFELTTAMAFLAFAEARCEVGVIEVGLGGTLDATNVIDPAISLITRLDLEHTAILGDTLAEIAANKAGIVKPGRPALTVAQEPSAMAVIAARAAEVGAPLGIADRDWTVVGDDAGFTITGSWGRIDGLVPSLRGRHQVENAALAIAGLRSMPGLSPIPDDAIRAGLRDAVHPGRFEVVAQGGRTVVLDGAHTPLAAAALADTLRRHFPDTTFTVVVAMLRDKTPEAFLAPLRPLATAWIVGQPASPRALAAADLAAAVGELHETAPSIAAALDRALADDRPVLVTGSLTTVAAARAALGLA